MKALQIFLFVFCCAFGSKGQSNQKLDTVNIYINKTGGVTYKSYLDKWFWDYNKTSFRWNPKKFNKQDSLVLFDKTPRFIKVYNKFNRLTFTGTTGGYDNELIGYLIYYYKNGSTKRIEYYNHIYTKDTCNCTFGMNDATGPEGIWKYFRKDGSIKKTVEYYIAVYSCVDGKYSCRKKVKTYTRKGKPLYTLDKIKRH